MTLVCTQKVNAQQGRWAMKFICFSKQTKATHQSGEKVVFADRYISGF
jgi:hypothetical protein